jgi:hypothetical protein
MRMESLGRMIITGENRRIWSKKSFPALLCPQQIHMD